LTSRNYGWIVTAACFWLTLLYGVAMSFGVFLDPLIREFGSSNALTSAVYSTYWISWGVSSLLMGILADRYSARLLLGFSGFLVGLGVGLSSYVSAVWQLYLTFGVIAGVGAGGLWIPASSIVLRWFKQGGSLNLALSLVALGSGTGVTLLAPIEGVAIAAFGWRAAYGIVALLSWGMTVAALIPIKNPPGWRLDQDRRVLGSGLGSVDTIKTWFFVSLFAAYGLAAGWVRQDMTVHIISYLEMQKLSYTVAVFALSIVGLGSVSGRLLSGFLSRCLGERTDDRVLLSLYFLLQSVSILMLMAFHSVEAVYFASFLFGVAWGGAVPEIPIILRRSFGTVHFGALFGVVSIGTGLGAVVGPIFGGYVYDLMRDYTLAFWTDVGLSLLASMLLVIRHKRASPG